MPASLLDAQYPAAAVKEYYAHLCQGKKLYVSEESKLHGKGLFAKEDIAKGETFLSEDPLVATQELASRCICLVCSRCFRFLGSLEEQLRLRLRHRDLVDDAEQSEGSDESLEEPLATVNANGATGASSIAGGSREPAAEQSEEERETISIATQSDRSSQPTVRTEDEDLIKRMKFTEQVRGPDVIMCPGGCNREVYCSYTCQEDDWKHGHVHLCMGRNPSLRAFYDHLADSNEIFELAAKALADVVQRARIRDSYQGSLEQAWMPYAMGHKGLWWETVACPEDIEKDSEDEALFRETMKEMASDSLALLISAWMPKNEASDSEEEIETAFNGLQVASEGSSVDKGSTSEAQGRRTDSKHSKGLDLDAPLTPEELSSVARVDLWGNIIGMFELNNLDLCVPSTVEEYFLIVDKMLNGSPNAKITEEERKELAENCNAFLERLGELYRVPVEFALLGHFIALWSYSNPNKT